MQQVVLPSLWPRKRNTRGPAAGEEGEDLDAGNPAGVPTRELGERMKREAEEERIGGMRWRGREVREGRDYEIPGPMYAGMNGQSDTHM